MSVYGDVLAMVETRLRALSLAGITTNVHVQKLPGSEENIDTLPLIAVVPSEDPPEWKRYNFGGQVEMVYEAEAVIINKGKKLIGATGNTDTKDDLYTQLDWQERCYRTFANPRELGITGLWQTEIRPGKPVDRSKVNANYDYIPALLRFRVVQQGTN